MKKSRYNSLNILLLVVMVAITLIRVESKTIQTNSNVLVKSNTCYVTKSPICGHCQSIIDSENTFDEIESLCDLAQLSDSVRTN